MRKGHYMPIQTMLCIDLPVDHMRPEPLYRVQAMSATSRAYRWECNEDLPHSRINRFRCTVQPQNEKEPMSRYPTVCPGQIRISLNSPSGFSLGKYYHRANYCIFNHPHSLGMLLAYWHFLQSHPQIPSIVDL